MKVAIIDYGSGNLRSASKAFERCVAETGLSADILLTSDPEDVLKSDRIVLPGVGAFADCKNGLSSIDGMITALEEVALEKARPFLGICVGMQLLATYGLEHGKTKGLGWIPGEVSAIQPQSGDLKIPHMGWNTLELANEHPLFDNIPLGTNGLHAYFVHSYAFNPVSQDHLIATTEYGKSVPAFIAKDNLAGSQFHPEKSQKLGLTLIKNFLGWSP